MCCCLLLTTRSAQQPSFDCKLVLQGTQNTTWQAKLTCTGNDGKPPVAASAVTVAVDGSLIQEQQARQFGGVNVVGSIDCQMRWTAAGRPVGFGILFCGNYSIRFVQLDVQNVAFPQSEQLQQQISFSGEQQSFTADRGIIVFGGTVDVVMPGGQLSNNTGAAALYMWSCLITFCVTVGLYANTCSLQVCSTGAAHILAPFVAAYS